MLLAVVFGVKQDPAVRIPLAVVASWFALLQHNLSMLDLIRSA